MNGEKFESCSRTKDENGRLTLGGAEVRRIRKGYFEELYNIETQEKVSVHICGFEGIQRGNYFGGEQIRRTEVKIRLRKLKNGKVAGKDEVTREIIKSGHDMVVDWSWRL